MITLAPHLGIAHILTTCVERGEGGRRGYADFTHTSDQGMGGAGHRRTYVCAHTAATHLPTTSARDICMSVCAHTHSGHPLAHHQSLGHMYAHCTHPAHTAATHLPTTSHWGICVSVCAHREAAHLPTTSHRSICMSVCAHPAHTEATHLPTTSPWDIYDCMRTQRPGHSLAHHQRLVVGVGGQEVLGVVVGVDDDLAQRVVHVGVGGALADQVLQEGGQQLQAVARLHHLCVCVCVRERERERESACVHGWEECIMTAPTNSSSGGSRVRTGRVRTIGGRTGTRLL